MATALRSGSHHGGGTSRRRGGAARVANKGAFLWEKFPKFVLGFLVVSTLATFGAFTRAQSADIANLSRWAFLFTFAGSVFTLAAAIYLGVNAHSFAIDDVIRYAQHNLADPAHSHVRLSDRSESSRHGVLELRCYQLVTDLCGSGCDEV